MKASLVFLFVALVLSANCQQLPEGVTTKTFECTYAPGQSGVYYYKNNEMIGMVQPGSCFYSENQGGRVDPFCFAEFYYSGKKDTFATSKEATAWLVAVMEDYYKPVEITKWQKLKVQPPKISLKYPWDWSYKLSKYDGIFKSKILSENKLTLLLKDQRGNSEICMIIRTPNTAGLTTKQVMELTSHMNGAVNVNENQVTDYTIAGKMFKTSQNSFMIQMQQFHFWYADEQEIIYINYNLLKDEKLRYPEIMKTILQSISW